MVSRLFGTVSIAFSVALGGCQSQTEDRKSVDAADAGTPKIAGKVEQAVLRAVQAQAQPASAASAGPPADGVMDPERANAELALGASPKVTVGDAGKGTKFLLRSPLASLPRSLNMEVTVAGGGMEQGLPPLDVALSLESSKGKSAADALAMTASIRDVKVSMPNVPPEFSQQLAQLKGSRITFSMTKEGGGYGFSQQLAAGARAELRDLLDAVAEGLASSTVAVPSVPVGAGAFWMVVSRESSAGFPLISYRMVKALSVTEKSSELEFDARRYAIGRAIDPTLLPPGSPPAALRELSAGAKGKLKIASDSLLASWFEGETALRGVLDDGMPAAKGQPGGRMVQSGTGYRITAVK